MVIECGSIFTSTTHFYIEGSNLGGPTGASFLKIFSQPGSTAGASGFACYSEVAGSTVYKVSTFQNDLVSAACTSFGVGTTPWPFTWSFSVGYYSTVLYPTGNLYLMDVAAVAPLPADPGYRLKVGGTSLHTGQATFAASGSSFASINMPHGSAPSSPVNGDWWTTTAGAYVRINGVTIGPLGASGSGGDQCPYYIAVGSSYTVAEYRQVLFVLPIEVDGDLTVDGVLIEMGDD
jgi:hypothetical protein